MKSLKSTVKTLLNRTGFYQRLRVSMLYDIYWRFADRRILDRRKREVSFYREVLEGFPKKGLIFDIGANAGEKTDMFVRLCAKVVAIDPDEFNQQILRQKFLRYRLVPKPVVVVGKAVSDRTAVETMWIDAPGSAMNTLSPKWVEVLKGDRSRCGTSNFAHKKEVETISLEDLFAAYGVPFFMKIDVEGHELSVLRALRRPVPYLSFEVNLPEFRLEGFECVELLGRLTPRGEFNYVVDCKRGLELERWLGSEEFLKAFKECRASSVEVFWRTEERHAV